MNALLQFCCFLTLPVAVCALQVPGFTAGRTDWKAGAARVEITPTRPVWMAGYAARKKPSEGVLQPLYARAVALQDEKGDRAVLVSADLLGFPQAVSRRIAQRVRKEHRLPRERLVLNASHTHGGPVIGDTLRVGYQEMTEQQWKETQAYTREVEEHVIRCIGEALKALQPARLDFGKGRAFFAANRRLQLNPNGPVDHEAPVLRVTARDGDPIALLFGYACHNTTLGADFLRFHGDYAGIAQDRLEKKYPGARALFVCGCGADANPAPRGKLEQAVQYGEELAKSVEETLERPMKPLNGPLRCAYTEVPLKFAPFPDKAGWEARLADPNVYVRRHARQMLDTIEREGRIRDEYPYPVQVWRFGADLDFIALAGEVVVDYALRLKREFGTRNCWVSGYNNDVFAYIPSERVLSEGGYEGAGAMLYYGQPGAFAPGVEETIIRTVHRLAGRRRAGSTPRLAD